MISPLYPALAIAPLNENVKILSEEISALKAQIEKNERETGSLSEKFLLALNVDIKQLLQDETKTQISRAKFLSYLIDEDISNIRKEIRLKDVKKSKSQKENEYKVLIKLYSKLGWKKEEADAELALKNL